jgi:proteic killer suppression protein
MKVTFKNVKLRKFCEAKSSSKKLRARLADLGAVESVQDLVYGKPHPLKGDRAGQFALSLEGAERLVFEPSNNPIPYLNDESIDWSEVTEVCIIFVGDYHD